MRVNETKFLGVYYDEKLTFKPHINYLTQRLSRTCALIYRVRNLMPTFVLKNMYHAHVGSLISYCNIIWANGYETSLSPMILILKRIIRNVTNSEFLAHTAPLFKRLKILDLDGVRKVSLASYFYKTQNISVPPLIPNHRYDIRNRDRLRPPQHRLTLFQNSFLFQAPRLWNDLIFEYPRNIVNSPNIKLFKRRLKHYLVQ